MYVTFVHSLVRPHNVRTATAIDRWRRARTSHIIRQSKIYKNNAHRFNIQIQYINIVYLIQLHEPSKRYVRSQVCIPGEPSGAGRRAVGTECVNNVIEFCVIFITSTRIQWPKNDKTMWNRVSFVSNASLKSSV